MNKKIYKLFGIILMLVTFVFVLTSLSNGYIQYTGDLYNFSIHVIYLLIFIFIFGFFPGLFFYRFGNENNESNKLIKSALILQIISITLVLFSYIVSLFSSGPYAPIVPLYFFGIPASIIYGIGILLMLIYKFQTKNF